MAHWRRKTWIMQLGKTMEKYPRFTYYLVTLLLTLTLVPVSWITWALIKALTVVYATIMIVLEAASKIELKNKKAQDL